MKSYIFWYYLPSFLPANVSSATFLEKERTIMVNACSKSSILPQLALVNMENTWKIHRKYMENTWKITLTLTHITCHIKSSQLILLGDPTCRRSPREKRWQGPATWQVILATGSREKLELELGYNVLGEAVPHPGTQLETLADGLFWKKKCMRFLKNEQKQYGVFFSGEGRGIVHNHIDAGMSQNFRGMNIHMPPISMWATRYLMYRPFRPSPIAIASVRNIPAHIFTHSFNGNFSILKWRYCTI